jgi:hypothetical protein
MEPRNEQSEKPPEAPKAGTKPRRFRIVKLEERIAPQASAYLRDRPNSTTIDPLIC